MNLWLPVFKYLFLVGDFLSGSYWLVFPIRKSLVTCSEAYDITKSRGRENKNQNWGIRGNKRKQQWKKSIEDRNVFQLTIIFTENKIKRHSRRNTLCVSFAEVLNGRLRWLDTVLANSVTCAILTDKICWTKWTGSERGAQLFRAILCSEDMILAYKNHGHVKLLFNNSSFLSFLYF